MKIYDKDGYPVASIQNEPVKSFLRKLILGNVKQTYKAYRNRKLVACYQPLNIWGYMDSEIEFYEDDNERPSRQ
jgi:hypothetical protein